MNHISLRHFAGSALCQSQLYCSRESFLPITYDFISGNAYGLYSDFGRGSWALATCLGGRGLPPLSGDIYINTKKATNTELKQHACFVGGMYF